MEGIILREGKYHFYFDAEGILRCKRYGEPWRDFIGDNAVLALFRHAVELQERVDGFEQQRMIENDEAGNR